MLAAPAHAGTRNLHWGDTCHTSMMLLLLLLLLLTVQSSNMPQHAPTAFAKHEHPLLCITHQ
jgi:hypothetical protein